MGDTTELLLCLLPRASIHITPLSAGQMRKHNQRQTIDCRVTLTQTAHETSGSVDWSTLTRQASHAEYTDFSLGWSNGDLNQTKFKNPIAFILTPYTYGI